MIIWSKKNTLYTKKKIYNSLATDIKLSEENSTPYVFIIDRYLKLRGRDDDEGIGKLYGFNAESVAEINNKMVDDVKIILAEYRLALKKNDSLFKWKKLVKKILAF